jgi:hypothetical protein
VLPRVYPRGDDLDPFDDHLEANRMEEIVDSATKKGDLH